MAYTAPRRPRTIHPPLPRPPKEAGAAGTALLSSLTYFLSFPQPETPLNAYWGPALSLFGAMFGDQAKQLHTLENNPVQEWLLDLYAVCSVHTHTATPDDLNNPSPLAPWRANTTLYKYLIEMALQPLLPPAPPAHQPFFGPPPALPTPPPPPPPRPTSTNQTATTAPPRHPTPPRKPRPPAQHTLADDTDTTSHHIIFENFNLPFALRPLVHDPQEKPKLIAKLRALIISWGFDSDLVQQAFIFVLSGSGDIRLTMPDHTTARALLGGSISKPVLLDSEPILRRNGAVIATIYTPPPPKTKTKTGRQGYETLDTLRPSARTSATHPKEKSTDPIDLTINPTAGNNDNNMDQQPPEQTIITTGGANANTLNQQSPDQTTNPTNSVNTNTPAQQPPNPDGLPTPPSNPAGPAAPATVPSASDPDATTEAEMTDANSRSRTSTDRSPDKQARRLRQRTRSDSDQSIDALLGIGST